MAEDLQARYFIREGDAEPHEVDVQEWMRLEELAGFHSKRPGFPATGSFGNTSARIYGSIAYTEEDVSSVLVGLKSII